MSALLLALCAQLAAPVLAFPEPGVDDTAAYQGYQTRLFRDAARNTFQVYLDRREGRVVHLWADGENASIGFSARSATGVPAILRWATSGITTGTTGRARTMAYDLVATSASLDLGAFLLGSMRTERDFQAWGRHRRAFSTAPFVLDEVRRLLDRLATLPQGVRTAHLRLLHVGSVAALRERLTPSLHVETTRSSWRARFVQPSLDARDTMTIEVRVDPTRVTARRVGQSVTFRARRSDEIPFTVLVSTTGPALTPLDRTEIFSPAFLTFLEESLRADPRPGSRAHWMERQVRGVELLSSRDKLMAGLPTYATYFGRDMLVSALMMRSIWREDMSEFVVASALRKLSPSGQVSHEEALGGQAVREAAAEYVGLVDASAAARGNGRRQVADSLMARAADVLREHRRTRENYHMIDDELQFAVLAARWLGDPRVSRARKTAFLADSAGGRTNLDGLLREFALVARMTAPYAESPVATNLISFARRDAGWASTSWRDSNAGYAGGRYAMDVNAIWAPHAVAAIATILGVLGELGVTPANLEARLPELAASPLGAWIRDPARARAAARTWEGAAAHFVVRLAPADVQRQVVARLAALPAVERTFWNGVVARTGAARDSLSFLALALDANARPIPVVNTDVATGLFLGEATSLLAEPDADARAVLLRDVRTFVRPYPVGLFIDRVGPVVANDAYARPEVWSTFTRDPYHGPRVAWGREVNLFLLGLSERLAAAGDTTRDDGVRTYVRELRSAARQVVDAVESSGFHSELWSYVFRGGAPAPVRYGSGADVQLWSTTDLAVQFALHRLGLRR